MPLYSRCESLLHRISAGLAILGGLGLIFATLVTCISIILKLLGRLADSVISPEALPWLAPILGEEEIVAFAVGFALFSALPWVMIQRGHIRVELFKKSCPDRLNRALDLLSDVALTAIAYLIVTRQWGLIFKSPRGDDLLVYQLILKRDWGEFSDRLRTSQESQIIGIPLWPTYIVAEICVIIFFFVALFCCMRSFRAFVGMDQVRA